MQYTVFLILIEPLISYESRFAKQSRFHVVSTAPTMMNFLLVSTHKMDPNPHIFKLVHIEMLLCIHMSIWFYANGCYNRFIRNDSWQEPSLR